LHSRNYNHSWNSLLYVYLFELFLSVDVTDYDQVVAKAQQVRTQIGDVTILVNNAGIMPTHPLLQQTKEEIRKVFDINVMAHFWVKLLKTLFQICYLKKNLFSAHPNILTKNVGEK
jgi:short-subunit dehydrogenase involved in D-alanine esterification of teichoic acids